MLLGMALRYTNDNGQRVVSPSAVSMIQSPHPTFPVVQGKFGLLYMSGFDRITEFRVSPAGFSVLVWKKDYHGDAILISYTRPEHSTGKGREHSGKGTASLLWSTLEHDVNAGHARLSNREAVFAPNPRNVGTRENPEYRTDSRLTDSVQAVCNWIRRAEQWFEKSRDAAFRGKKEKTESLESPDKISVPSPTEIRTLDGNSVPSSLECEAKQIVNSRYWDRDGALAINGKRVASNSVSSKVVLGAKERIRRLRETSARNLEMAKLQAEQDNPLLAEIYLEFASEADSRANAVQSKIDARMTLARSAKVAKQETCRIVAVLSDSVLSTLEATNSSEDETEDNEPSV